MFLNFFNELRAAKVPVTLKEYLSLMEAMDKGVIDRDVEDFYYLARAALVKDERNIDKFDKVFGHVFKGLDSFGDAVDVQDIPDEWLRKMTEKFLSPEEMAEIEAMGRLRETYGNAEKSVWKSRRNATRAAISGLEQVARRRLAPTATTRKVCASARKNRAIAVLRKSGTSASLRIMMTVSNSARATSKIALKRLRKWARTGSPDELDLNATIKNTARQGYLDIEMRPERRNTVSVLLLMDAGGSMDPHVKVMEELFSAARAEIKNLEYYYFHNCPYEGLWKDNRRRRTDVIPTWDVLHKYPSEYKVIVVGDADHEPL